MTIFINTMNGCKGYAMSDAYVAWWLSGLSSLINSVLGTIFVSEVLMKKTTNCKKKVLEEEFNCSENLMSDNTNNDLDIIAII